MPSTLDPWVKKFRAKFQPNNLFKVAYSNYRIYPCISRPFIASKEAPKIALDLYTGQRFRAKFQLNNLFKINIIILSWA